MSFMNFLDSVNESKFNDLKSRIKKCTSSSDHSKIVKDLDTAFKDKTISTKEYDELDNLLFDKFKMINNGKLSESEFRFIESNEEITESIESTDNILNEAKSDDILSLYRLLIQNKSQSTWRNNFKSIEIDENNNLISITNNYFRVGESVQRANWAKVLKLITKLFKYNTSFNDLLQKLEDEEVLLWKLYFNNSDFKMVISVPAEKGDYMVATATNKDFVNLLNKEGIIFKFLDVVNMPVDSVTTENNILKIKLPFLFLNKKNEKTDTIKLLVGDSGNAIYCNVPSVSSYEGDKVKETRDRFENFITYNLNFSNNKILKEFDALFKTLESRHREAELVKTVLREIGSEISSSNFNNEDEKSGYVSIKRWDKVNFIFDLDNATSADWVIERTLDKKSVVFLDKFVDKYNKKYKSKIHVSWNTSEKWNIDFRVQKI